MNHLIQQFVLVFIVIGLTIPTAQSEALSGEQLYNIACEHGEAAACSKRGPED